MGMFWWWFLCCFVGLFGWVCVLGWLWSVFHFPSIRCVSFPSMMTWAHRPHGVCARGKKRSPTVAQSGRRDNSPRKRAPRSSSANVSQAGPPGQCAKPDLQQEAVVDPLQGANQETEDADEEETEEETYLPATRQGCYSFQMSLLQRAAQTFSKRSLADKYGQVAKWLLTGPSDGHLAEKLTPPVKAQDLHHHPPCGASCALPTWICLH